MAYKKIKFEDRIVERPMTYNIITNEDGTITLEPVPGEVYKDGTPFNKTNMNHIEDGIVETEAKVEQLGNNIYYKDNYAILTGTMSINGTSFSYKDINYPNGFNATNCVVISQMSTPQGTDGILQSGKVTNSSINYSLADMTINPRVNLKSENIRIYMSNSNTSPATLNYKIVLMKME